MGKANIEMYHPGSAGSFVKVVMVNFMCHHHLTVELGPRINYIVGENGSGKSAVLTALTVALGAKAKSVGRSSTKSVKGMIKSGTQQAKLTVVISNDGEDAFMPATYGRTIIIEKVLAKVGANSLKIKNAQGETIGTKSDELARITDHFAIDVDNPIVVMTQDHLTRLLQQQPAAAGKSKLLLDGDVEDPFGKEQADYDACLALMKPGLDGIAADIKPLVWSDGPRLIETSITVQRGEAGVALTFPRLRRTNP